MSAHYVKKNAPPPGACSFTKIRLGWISPEQVVQVLPGQEQQAFLSPSARGGKTLAIKIPLSNDQYYLVENRQPIGFDRILPDSGVLVLKVDPRAQEGSGTVRVMDADPGSFNFSHATYKLGFDRRNRFVDANNNVAIIPLWSENQDQGVLVTTARKSEDALRALSWVQEIRNSHTMPQNERTKKQMEACLEAFQSFNFRKACRIAKEIQQQP